MTKAKRNAAQAHLAAVRWPGPPAVQQATYAITMSAALAAFMVTALALAPLALIQPKPPRSRRREVLPLPVQVPPTAQIIPFSTAKPGSRASTGARK